ncbi:MAG: MBL fold metallo-hydrolase [Thermoproteota archaeon]
MVLVKWHGHACVELRSSSGFTVVFDPHDGVSLGIRRPSAAADLVLISHDHFDHNAAHVVAKEGAAVLKMFFGERSVGEVKVKGIRSYHDKSRGAQRGLNAIYVVEVDGKRVAHLGDLGDIPGEDVLEELRGLDLLVTPVGGRYTIGPEEAWRIVEAVEPLNVMPIHYRIEGLRLPIEPVDRFLEMVSGYTVERLSESSFELERFSKAVVVPRPP